ncbi:MAG TPA: hypothetical protein VM600_09190, partial [Actinomycetota bacterium]|nr:hypothetical protein [Actinomycetota bacterium]
RDGIVLCWGANAAGQIGNGLIGSWSPPTPALIAPNVVEVVAGGRHTCARRYDNSVWCWGDNSGGQLGYDTSPLTFSARPVATPLTAP